jgi:FMN phosphatase YigB (HAD superfamily)
MNRNKLLIWDLDDTLIFTINEYESTNKTCAMLVSETVFGNHQHVDSILTLHRQIDLSLISEYGFVSNRYLQGWINTLKEVSQDHCVIPTESVFEKIEREIQDLYERKNQNIPEALCVLRKLSEEGYRMVVLTAGEEGIQHRRVREAGVLEFMDAIYVYPFKTPDTLKEVLANYEAYECYMIGNSLKSDIYPALVNNIWGIHAVRETWEADNFNIDINHSYYRAVSNLMELPNLLKQLHKIKV